MRVTNRKHMGKFLARRRIQLGLPVTAVARGCNVTRGRVYQWERERRVLPKNLVPLSRVLGLPLTALISENGNRPIKKRAVV